MDGYMFGNGPLATAACSPEAILSYIIGMSGMVLYGLEKRFGVVQALDGLSLHAEPGEFMVLLGPSGCGKTTALRCVAGVEEPSAGEIHLGERCVFSAAAEIEVAPKDRNIGLVFQNYALYPHMTVAQNVAFGLKTRKVDKKRIGPLVQEVLDLVGLSEFADRYPRSLSGGQQQRVAVARTIVKKPEYLLFDEPLSSLDPRLRVSLRADLLDLHRRLGTTSLYVTHDQNEAMILADRIAVMRNGHIEQIAPPDRVYHYPETAFVARFTGRPQTNMIRGVIRVENRAVELVSSTDRRRRFGLPGGCRESVGQEVYVHVRPENLDIEPTENGGSASVVTVMPRGADALIYLSYANEEDNLLANQTGPASMKLRRAQEVVVTIRRCNLFSVERERLIGSYDTKSD